MVDGHLAQIKAIIEESCRRMAETYRPSNYLRVKEASDLVLISRPNSQLATLRHCHRLSKYGVGSTVSVTRSVPGFQVSVYGRSIAEVEDTLRKFGLDVESGA